MIIDFFINLLSGIVGLLPAVPTGVTHSFSMLYELFNKINYYVPVSELCISIMAYVIVLNWRLGFNIIKWLAERIVI